MCRKPGEHSTKLLFFKDFIYLFERNHKPGEGAEGEGEAEADSLLSREPIRGSIPGPWYHDLS